MEKKIVVGVSGGIAAYKSVTLVSLLVKRGYEVRVVMTPSATKFVSPLTFQTMSRNRVYTDTFSEEDPGVVSHIDVADFPSLVVVAPATANLLGKVAGGIADEMLSTVLLATTAPVLFVPAMNVHMYTHPAVQENLQRLRRWGYGILEPAEGLLACGYTGKGRMEEPERIFQFIEDFFQGRVFLKSPNPASRGLPQDLEGKRILITAGPTQEALDPVRYLTNRSSGKMGYALARAARERGAEVRLISGPSTLLPPSGVERISVRSAEEMYAQVMRYLPESDWFIAAAAVADYRPKVFETQKMKKKGESLLLELVPTPDILKAAGERKRKDQILIGFAAETEHLEAYAREKLLKKNLDFIIANNVTEEGAGFDSDTNHVLLLSKSGERKEFPLMEKTSLAHLLLDEIIKGQGEPK
ncbi:Coenzyme A biosynthesis bifunctional protein CoaBC; phosphopantothenoylcysteine synthetase/decarboxylase [[Clostridium] ultunense Esp]|nr:Coenzyme A biosynthesis bifunctional protein CoaBC; phosphopantothenoylcysteine synthetase/decarboxylase [[Clostridium] ultunense Esp]